MNFFKIGLVYSLAEVVTKGFAFFLIPLFTNFLSVEDFGKLSLIDSFFSLLSILITASIYIGFTRYYNEYKEQLLTLLSTTFFFSLFLIVVINILVIISFYLLDFFSNSLFILVYLALLRASFFQLSQVFFTYFLVNFDSKKSLVYGAIRVSLIFIMIYYSLIINNFGLIGIYTSYALAELILFLSLLFKFKKLLIFKPEISIVKKLLSFSIWSIPSGLSYIILTMSDRFFITNYSGLKETAIFALIFNISLILKFLFIQPFQNVFNPYKYKNWNEVNANKLFNDWFLIYNIIAVLLIISILFNIDLLMFLLANDEYKIDLIVVFLLLLSVYMYGMTPFYTIGIQIKNKNYKTTLIMFLGMLVNLFLNFIFVPIYGILGASATSFFSFLVINLLLNFISKKYYNVITYKFKKIFVLYSLAGLIYIFWYLVSHLFELTIFIKLILSIILVLIFTYMIYSFKVLDISQLKVLKSV